MDENNRIWKLERQVFQLQTLFEIAQALSQCRERDQVFDHVLATMAGTFGARKALALRCEDSRWLISAARGTDANNDELKDLLQSRDFAEAREREQHLLLNRILGGGSHGDDSYTLWRQVRVRDTVAGGFYFGRKIRPEPYSREDENLLAAACRNSAYVLENISLYEEITAARERLAAENLTLRQEVRKDAAGREIIGSSEKIRKVLDEIRQCARSDASVLITGETGTGKELVARAIHYQSARADGPFVAINCTAIPESLVESEFFGIESGTATGVKQRVGYFELADKGTLFIDEVGDMPLSSQAKLLRTLQEKMVRRVGGTAEKPIDVRVVAATNKNLKEEIRTGRFREDLYYRLGVLEIRVPPLRERAEDISLLTHHFITEKSRKLGKKIRGIHPEACRILEKYSWPGNIRELENEVERFVTLAEEDQIIGVEHLSNHLEDDISDAFLAEQPFAGTLRETVDRLERMIIEKALEEAEGNKSRVARTLGLSRLGLQKKMDRLGIIYPKNTHVTQS